MSIHRLPREAGDVPTSSSGRQATVQVGHCYGDEIQKYDGGTKKTDTEYFGDLEAETTETEDVDN